MAMAAAHDAQYHLTYADTSIAPPASRHDGIYTPSEDLHGQAYESDSHSYLDNTSTSVPYHCGDERAASGVSPRDTQATRPDAIVNLHLVDEDTILDAAESLKSPSRTKHHFRPEKDCPTRRNFRNTRLTWLSGTIIFISSVSTALSALFVVLALKGQRYGNYIGNNPGAKISISAAILWTSVLAKTIELSFVTAFVAFLGQKISRRAMTDSMGQGVSISELSMWRWAVQPGSIFTSSEIARYAGFSTLGTLTLLSTILSTLYVTAATALVQPVAKNSDWHKKTMAGLVKSDFANINYIKSLCQTPIADIEAGNICMQAESAGKSFYNLAEFLAHWEDVVDVKGARSRLPEEQEHRPTWIGLPYANTRIVPQWIHVVDTTEASRRYNRVINNVSLALPHIGVSNAAHDQRNHMPQSDTSDSIEPYSLWASVPSPVMKVLCVHMNETELEPIIYDAWPNSNLNVADWTSLPGPRDNATTTNKTVVDELFGWVTENRDTTLDYPPVFARYPLPFNTIVNHTSFAWGRTAIYLLGQGGPKTLGSDLTGVYPLCKLEVEITARCSTRHTVSSSESTAEALCEDRASNMAYFQNAENATDPKRTQVLENWRDIGTNWANSISLGTGLMDSNDSLQRTLMSLALDPEASKPSSIQAKLNPFLPSLAETLAITASDTILMSLQDSPLVNYWNYSHPQLDESQNQWFRAKIKSKEYASGGVDNASKGWLVVLIATLLLNVFLLCYFILQPGFVTDFTQPAQLFALAVNSPPAQALAGSCGGGPEGKDYKFGWYINHEGGHVYIEPVPGRETRLPTDQHDHDRVVAVPDKYWKALTRRAVWGHSKPYKESRTGRATSTSDTEPLQPSRNTQSVFPTHSRYELEEVSRRL